MKMFSLSVNEVIFSLPLSLDPSLLSLFYKNGPQSHVAWKEGARESRGEASLWGHSPSTRSLLWARPLWAYRHQGSRQANRPSPNWRPPRSTAQMGNRRLRLAHYLGHTDIAGTKFWVQKPGFPPLAPSSLPPPLCRVHLFIWRKRSTTYRLETDNKIIPTPVRALGGKEES